MDKEFSNQARDTLNAKMENYGEKRDAIMTDMKDKLKVCNAVIFQNPSFIIHLRLVLKNFKLI